VIVDEQVIRDNRRPGLLDEHGVEIPYSDADQSLLDAA